jgi:hypothetical protein
MAITSITISQDNKSGDIDLLSLHNPLVFLVDVVYTASAPDTLYVELQDGDDAVLETFSAIPYQDSAFGSTRTFAFIATDILKGYMGSIEDFAGTEKTLEYVDGITTEFTLRFYIDAVENSVSFVACHAARQFGDTPYMESIFNNDDQTYYAAENLPVYVYFYNDDAANVVTVFSGEVTFDRLLDYDDVAFLDFDDLYLIAI